MTPPVAVATQCFTNCDARAEFPELVSRESSLDVITTLRGATAKLGFRFNVHSSINYSFKFSKDFRHSNTELNFTRIQFVSVNKTQWSAWCACVSRNEINWTLLAYFEPRLSWTNSLTNINNFPPPPIKLWIELQQFDKVSVNVLFVVENLCHENANVLDEVVAGHIEFEAVQRFRLQWRQADVNHVWVFVGECSLCLLSTLLSVPDDLLPIYSHFGAVHSKPLDFRRANKHLRGDALGESTGWWKFLTLKILKIILDQSLHRFLWR